MVVEYAPVAGQDAPYGAKQAEPVSGVIHGLSSLTGAHSASGFDHPLMPATLDDAPLLEVEVGDGANTARVTVDRLPDGTVFAMLAMEPDDGELRQVVLALTPERCDALMNALADAAKVLEDGRSGGVEA